VSVIEGETMKRVIPCLLFLFLLCASAASAGDGRTEISQASVLAGGGFPFVISASGSYVLTSDLTVSDPDTDAIQIGVDDVSLDLNGFTIQGPVSCTGGTGGVTISCTPSGQGSAIVSDDIFNNNAKRSNLIVRNGTIRGFAQNGVLFFFHDFGFLLQDVTVAETGEFAALLQGAVVRNSVLRASGDVEIDSGVVAQVSAFGIDDDFTVNGTLVANSNASGGNSEGLLAGTGVAVVDSSIRDNEGFGISCTSCLANGNAIDGNGLSGIAISGAAGFSGGYTNNVINDHPSGDPVTGAGATYMFPNLCDGSTSSSVCDSP
jgi:hypothetical protein